MTAGTVALRPFDPALADALVQGWRASFEDAVGVVDPHPLAEQRAYLLDKVVPAHSVRVAWRDGAMAGFVAASATSIAQLYVWRGCQGQGIGTQLLDWAKAQSDGSLWLYTFQRNTRACAFYERHGFRAVARGFEPTWQLADVRYAWRHDGG